MEGGGGLNYFISFLHAADLKKKEKKGNVVESCGELFFVQVK